MPFQRPKVGRNLFALSTEERSVDVPSMTYLFPSLVSSCAPALAVTQCSSRFIQPLWIQPGRGFSSDECGKGNESLAVFLKELHCMTGDSPTNSPGWRGSLLLTSHTHYDDDEGYHVGQSSQQTQFWLD